MLLQGSHTQDLAVDTGLIEPIVSSLVPSILAGPGYPAVTIIIKAGKQQPQQHQQQRPREASTPGTARGEENQSKLERGAHRARRRRRTRTPRERRRAGLARNEDRQGTERSKGQPVPKWDLKQEREHEAKNPGPNAREGMIKGRAAEAVTAGDVAASVGQKLILETSNVSSVITNALTIWSRKAHIQMLQETLVPPGAAGRYKQEAKHSWQNT